MRFLLGIASKKCLCLRCAQTHASMWVRMCAHPGGPVRTCVRACVCVYVYVCVCVCVCVRACLSIGVITPEVPGPLPGTVSETSPYIFHLCKMTCRPGSYADLLWLILINTWQA